MVEGLTGWPAGIAVAVGALLVGFRIYLQTRSAIRGDQGHEVVSEGYKGLIEELQKELIRRGKALEEMNKVNEENLKLKQQLADEKRKVEVLEAVVRTQTDSRTRKSP